MKVIVFLLVLVFRQVETAFVPQKATGIRYASCSVLFSGIKDREDLVHELSELAPITKSKSHDANPWKIILENVRAHPVVTADHLRWENRKLKDEKQDEIAHLEERLVSLFNVARELFSQEITMAKEIEKLEKERNSLRALFRRIFVVVGRRLLSPFKFFYRLGRKTKDT